MKLVLMLLVLDVRELTQNLLINGKRHNENLTSEKRTTVLSTPLIFTDTSPCHVTTTEHEVTVDCANKKLDHLKPEWFPLNATILNLEGNILDSIPEGIFENCSQLQTLNLNNNKIKTIMPRAFLGLHKLENLYLGMNQLDICDKRFSVSAFEQLDNLKMLYLLQNLPFDKDQYCYGFIGNIVSLTSLSIDTQGKHVYFGEEFQNLTKLEKLRITGDAEIITDDSFMYLGNLKNLSLGMMLFMRNVSINFLAPLVKLDKLFMTDFHIGIEYTLSLLHPFVGRNMTTIYLRRINKPTPWFANKNHMTDGLLDANKTKILREICVSDFYLINSFLYYAEVNALTSETWDKCLQNIDLSLNLWLGSEIALFSVFKLKNLKSTVLRAKTRSFSRNNFPTVIVTPQLQDLRLSEKFNLKLPERDKLDISLPTRIFLTKTNFNSNESLYVQEDRLLTTNKVNTQNLSTDYKKGNVFISRTLVFIDLSSAIASMSLESHVNIIGAKNFEYIDISFCGILKLTGTIEGFTGLKTIIASQNEMSIVSPTFFDTFPALETLAIASCRFEVNFFSTQGTRFLSSLKKLKRLDLSSNSLSILSPDIFKTNTNLTELSLSGNRFSEIPFSMTNTPKLTRLDVRYNAITTLLPPITDKLDLLAYKWGKLELFLDGNILSCACQNIKFLQWLRLTAVTLDRNGNFTCINEQGVLTYTDAYIDLEGFWRQCWGQFFFYLSLILFSFMTIGMLFAFVINKYRTYIISQLLGIFFGFRQHLPGDYKIGVFFAYEDLDYQFITGDLKRFVEQRLGMSTYIRHRDLDPGVVLGEAIAEAIASCWRTVIIINQDFQDSSEYFQFTCRSAVSMINLANPLRVLVLVTERYRHRIPRDILSAIQEDNIVVVKRLEMDGAMQQIFRNRLTR